MGLRRLGWAVVAGSLAVITGCGTSTASLPAAPTPHHALDASSPPPAVVGYAKGSSVAVYPTAATAPGPTTHLSSPNDVGAPLVFLVVRRQGGWDQVMLPQRPNGSTGWVQEGDLTLYHDDFRVVVKLAAHTLDVYRSGVDVDHATVAIGLPSSPTPPGSFYITELLKAPDPTGAYGPYAFGLSDFSNTYTEFDGGPGQVAIHGTNQPGLVGRAVSHGCVRLANVNLVALVGLVPVGTPVQILG